jgi:hypothetical protein
VAESRGREKRAARLKGENMFASSRLNASLLCPALLCLLVAANCSLPHGLSLDSARRERGMIMSHSQSDSGPQPSPKLSPAEVVAIQLQALQRNDTPTKDNGIAVAFRFASPANQSMTGPLSNFILLVRNPLYQPMLNHRSAERGEMKIDGNKAEQRVTLMSATNERAVYIFTLSKQQDGEFKDCWMTDGVERVRSDSQLKGEQVARGNGHLRGRLS